MHIPFQKSVWRANLTCIDDNAPQEEHPGLDMEILSQLCSHASQEPMYENMRHIKNVISETKIGNPFSIQLAAWKLFGSRKSSFEKFKFIFEWYKPPWY